MAIELGSAVVQLFQGFATQIKFMKIIVERFLQSCGHSSLKSWVSWRSDNVFVAFDICPAAQLTIWEGKTNYKKYFRYFKKLFKLRNIAKYFI